MMIDVGEARCYVLRLDALDRNVATFASELNGFTLTVPRETWESGGRLERIEIPMIDYLRPEPEFDAAGEHVHAYGSGPGDLTEKCRCGKSRFVAS